MVEAAFSVRQKFIAMAAGRTNAYTAAQLRWAVVASIVRIRIMNDEPNMSRFLEEAQSIIARHRETGACFNWIDMLGLERDEQTHSNILAYLLDPLADHGQSDLFIRTFLQEVISFPQIEIDLKNVVVTRESVLGPKERVDVQISFPDARILLIENKVDAPEGAEQIERYLEWLEEENRKRSTVSKHVLIFLTPDGAKPQTARKPEAVVIECLDYSRIATWLRGVSRNVNVPVRLQPVLEQCSEVWFRIGGYKGESKMTKDLIDLCTKSQYLGAALAISQLDLRKHIRNIFWGRVKDHLLGRLQQESLSEFWKVERTPAWVGIFWKTCEVKRDQYQFAVLFDQWDHDKNPPYYGISRGSSVSVKDLVDQDLSLSNALTESGYQRTETYFCGWRYADNMNNDHERLLKLNLDNQSLEFPLSHSVAELLWELFGKYRMQLEALNQDYRYFRGQ